MAYGFGTTVNPQLGAVDYSNYLRGALSGAQMQAQGGAAIGAGVQNALAGIGEGIEKFQQNQQEIAAMAGDVKGMTQANPYLLESLDPKQMKVLESIRDGDSVKKKDMLEVYGAISAKNKMAQQQAEAQSRAVQDALNRAQIGKIENENRLRQKTKKINKNVRDIFSANTDTEGKLQTDTLLTDLINAGTPVDFAVNTVSNIVNISEKQRQLASPDNAFRANAYTVENPDTGEKYTVVNTSSGSAQIMRPPGEETTTAFQQDISEKQKQFANARKNYESGNVISAIQILRSLGVKSNITGNLIGPDDLEEFYGVDTSSQNLNNAGSVNYRDVAEVLNANAG
jgi:hypothetical protein